MNDLALVTEALQGYRQRLLKAGKPLQAAAVAHCISIVKRIAASKKPPG